LVRGDDSVSTLDRNRDEDCIHRQHHREPDDEADHPWRPLCARACHGPTPSPAVLNVVVKVRALVPASTFTRIGSVRAAAASTGTRTACGPLRPSSVASSYDGATY